MKISYDTQADALYIKFKDGIFGYNKEVDEGLILDVDTDGHILGIEILEVSSKFSLKDIADVNIQMPLNMKVSA